jgi:prepilin-type N-terminal cleavage/methylation domain-containing protein
MRQYLSRLFNTRAPSRQRFVLRRRSERGLSLIELLVASAITSVVILVAGYGLIAALNGEKVAQAMSARRSELNRAFDFMTNEIRMAQSINRTASYPPSGTSASVADVVAQSGLSLSALGSYGTLALYLEVPTTNPTATCPAEFDRIVYDIRPSADGWLPPRTIHRYGRTPRADGTINPCSTPISSDVLVDAVAEKLDNAPVCSAPGVLTGADGFMACVNGAQVDLFLQSAVAGKSSRKIQSAASSRLVSITQSLNSIQLLQNRASATASTIDFSWVYPGTATSITYELSRTINGVSSVIYTGSNTSYTENLATLTSVNSGTSMTYWVEVKSGSQSLGRSNEVTVTK